MNVAYFCKQFETCRPPVMLTFCNICSFRFIRLQLFFYFSQGVLLQKQPYSLPTLAKFSPYSVIFLMSFILGRSSVSVNSNMQTTQLYCFFQSELSRRRFIKLLFIFEVLQKKGKEESVTTKNVKGNTLIT